MERPNIQPCTPPFWANGGHLQTILGHVLPSPKLTEVGEEVHITLESENERIHSTYLKGESDVVVYLFHGLAGSAEATYTARTALQARSLGHHVFLNNHRGCGKGLGLATEPYHSGRAEDLGAVIEHGRKKFPNHRHLAIGFSLSANALLLLSSGARGKSPPDFAIAANGPINLDRASDNLTKGLNKIYDHRFVKDLKVYVRQNRPHDVRDDRSVKDVRTFDEFYTARLGGFRDRTDYYETCSAKKYLSQITIPTVLLTAADDPFVDVRDYHEAQLGPRTVLHVEAHGGHMGYVSKGFSLKRRWLDRTLLAYMIQLTSTGTSAPGPSRAGR